MTDEERMGGYTPRRALRFYVPLLLQAFSQSLTYPLVGAIASRGSYGVDELTAFTQGQIVMFFIGAVGGGLVTTGMVFARSRLGYAAFKALNAWMMLGLVAIQLACAIGPQGEWLFETLFNLPDGASLFAAIIVVLQLLSYVAQTEREFIHQRQAEGIAAAKARGARFGRPAKPVPPEAPALIRQWQSGRLTASAASRQLGISRKTFMKWASLTHD